MIDAVDSQKDRLHGPSGEDIWGGVNAKRFRHDPNRQMEDNFEIVAGFVKPDDVFVDAGGGAGRIGLPMALRFQEVINVEPSAGMCQEFMESAEEAGKFKKSSNVHANWLDSHGISGDVVHSANVTYFVRDIGLFVERLVASARRRVILSSYSVPNPCITPRCSRWSTVKTKQPSPATHTCFRFYGRWTFFLMYGSCLKVYILEVRAGPVVPKDERSRS
ncbi:MAG: hypothetical protein Ct9H300mP11_31960 [Chloroflexota bacterium]|nr:MAG: hypothetical protein Ct9H300mP11_31960 [Chloroflexota bacterium]